VAVRLLIPPTPIPSFFAPSVTISVYTTAVC
jgi:hypothetical protein